MNIGINCGHTKIGVGTGASKYLVESVETRKIVSEMMNLLADTQHEVFYLGIDKSSNNLKYVVDTANNSDLDIFVSVHLNADGGHGCEAFTWKGTQLPKAINICKNLSALGFTNRGVKDGSGLYVIKNTKMTAILVEVCFVDNVNDAALYNKLDTKKIADAIVKGLIN